MASMSSKREPREEPAAPTQDLGPDMVNYHTQKKKDQHKACMALKKVWMFLSEHLGLANSHGADFITDHHWEMFVPQEARQQLMGMSDDQLVGLPGLSVNCRARQQEQLVGQSDLSVESSAMPGHSPTSNTKNECDWLSSFISGARQCQLNTSGILSTMSEIEEACGRGQQEHKLIHEVKSKTTSEAMSEKKNHEIQAMSKTVVAVYKSCKANVIVDIGSGKGYLGQELSHRYNLPVLGLDSCQINTHGAVIRDKKMDRVWKHLDKQKKEKFHLKSLTSNENLLAENIMRADQSLITGGTHLKNEVHSENGVTSLNKFVPVTLTVNPEMNLLETVQAYGSHLGVENALQSDILLTGLHACGKLSVTLMDLFLHTPQVVGCCFVGCCYQLMEESNCPGNHFPLSDFGKQQKIKLGRNARNLASQSVARIQRSHQLQGADFSWRALLNVFLCELGLAVPEKIKGMRALNKRARSFHEYVQSAFLKLNLSPQLVNVFVELNMLCG